MSKKILFLSIALSVIALLAICFFAIIWGEGVKNPAGTKEETMGQSMIYNNSRYGYEFSYPEGTVIEKEDPSVEGSPVTVYDDDAKIEIMVTTESWFQDNFQGWKPDIGADVKTYSVGDRYVALSSNFNSEWYRLLVAVAKDESNVIIVRQTKKTDLLDGIFDTLTFTEQETGTGEVRKEFSYPYTIYWMDNGISFSLKEISLGKTLAPERLSDGKGGFYAENEEVNALTLTFKITNYNTDYKCVEMNIRRVINEEGDMIAPNTSQFHFSQSGGCMIPGSTSEIQKILFVVPETDKGFDITTFGMNPDTLFTITLLDADGIVRTEPSLQLDKSVDEEGLRKILPYNADTFVCDDGGGNSYKTTGQASDLQNWFIFGGCPTSKDYRVFPGKEMILSVKTDISSCTECVCNNPSFSIYEYRGSEFVKVKDFNPDNKGRGGVLEGIYYTPTTDRIRIVARGCFYLDVYQEGETGKRITLNSLNEGEALHVGKTYRIVWSSAYLDGNINMELVNKDYIEGKAGAEAWEIYFNMVPIGNGVYEWRLEGFPSKDVNALYKIHIFSNNNPYIEDYSDKYFIISR